jgi:imidazolonepropionase-like amidohydrolase
VIPRGTVVIEDGRIAAVGPNVAVPDGARVIDASGKVVTPGFLDNASTLGLVEIGAVSGTNDMSTSDDAITAAFTVVDAINPLSTLIPVTRVEGITRAVVQPQNGSSLIAGTGALIDLGGDRVTAILHRNPTAMYAVLGESGAGRAGGSRGAAVLRLREALEDARDYAANNRTAYAESRRRDYALSRLDLEALVPVVAGEVPLAVGVHRASDILATLRLAQDLGLRLILMGVAEGWTVAGDIAGAGVPVVLAPMQNIPRFERLANTLENAARLDRAGVNVAFATFDAHNSRNLKQLAGNAVSYGMPHDAALRAVTVNGARIWGVDERYGTLEVGRDADVVVWSGDPLELTTTVEYVFIRGREMSKETRQRELLERYRSLPTRP